MKTTNILFAAVACATLILSSCSKPLEQPFEVSFVSADTDFPVETRLIYNTNYIGDIQKIDAEQLAAPSDLPVGLRTSETKITIKAINNSATELSNITFSLLPDGTFKKVSSTGTMNYEVQAIDKYKFAILYKKP